jgi:hypothetical protein
MKSGERGGDRQMPSEYFSERTVVQAIDVFTLTCKYLDPQAPEARELVQAWKDLLWRLDHQTAIDRAHAYRARVGLVTEYPRRIEQMRQDLAARAQEAMAAHGNSPPAAQDKAPIDWYSIEAVTDLSA